MSMARIPVAELQGQAGLVRATAGAPARSEGGGDLREWVQSSSISAGAMVGVGLGLAGLGGLGALLLHVGFFGTVLLGSMFTVGSGMAFLGVLKRKGRNDEPKALPPGSPPAVLAERARRVRALLERGGDFTFERLLAELRWTESVLLEILVTMKESGMVIEDLNLDTGEWVYRAQIVEYGAALPGGTMTLADRQAAGIHTEGHR